MREDKDFKAWMLEWGSEQVKRFWDWQASNPEKSRLYFSRLVGDAILDEIQHYIKLKGIVVDLGSGPGFLVDKLLARGVDTLAVESSTASVVFLEQQFNGAKHFLGVITSSIDKLEIDDEYADIVFLIETVEHLDEEILSKVLAEACRILKPSGIIVVTVPNDENLTQNQIMCPSCGCVFHTVQHVRSLSADSLVKLMMKAGFVHRVCKPTLFSWHKPFLRLLHRLRYLVTRQPFPHLLYIGNK